MVTTATLVTPVGATQLNVPGVVNVAHDTGIAGVTLLDAALHGPKPMTFCALTLKVYAVPVVSPLMVMGDDAAVPVMQPGVDVAVYPVIVAGTPAHAGAVNGTDTDVAEATVTVPTVGAPGPAGHNPWRRPLNCWERLHIPL
jgi:hypothetical protein